MKRITAIALILIVILSTAACKKEKEPVYQEPRIYTKSDVVKKESIKTTYNLVTFDEINEDGSCEVTNWHCSKKDRNFEFKEKDDKYEDLYVDVKTKVLMGEIIEYDRSYGYGLYQKTTTLKYFMENATKTFEDKPLYFKIKVTDDHIDEVELFWTYYFAEADANG